MTSALPCITTLLLFAYMFQPIDAEYEPQSQGMKVPHSNHLILMGSTQLVQQLMYGQNELGIN